MALNRELTELELFGRNPANPGWLGAFYNLLQCKPKHATSHRRITNQSKNYAKAKDYEVEAEVGHIRDLPRKMAF